MDRLKKLRSEVGSSQDSTLDTTSTPSEAFMTANESSKYFSLSEVDTFDISSKDISLMSAVDSEKNLDESDQLIANLSPIEKKGHLLSNYKIGNQIEAANILSGGVNIFDDNESSYDGNELVIDDSEDKSNMESRLIGGDDKEPADDNETAIASKDSEVVLQIDGKNVDAIDIGNNLYLYRKDGEQELAAVQIIDDDQQQPTFKFLKVRENAEGNLEVYEEIQIEVPKEVPVNEATPEEKKTTHVPIKDINKIISDTGNKVSDKKNSEQKDASAANSKVELENKDLQTENGKTIKFSESRKSPLMTYHSTSNKEGIPLTKTMVDQQLHPSRHSDYNKKTIEVHTDTFKVVEAPTKHKDTGTPKLTIQETNYLEETEIKLEDEKSKESCLKASVNEISEDKQDSETNNSLPISHLDEEKKSCDGNSTYKEDEKITHITMPSTENSTKSITDLATLDNTDKVLEKQDDTPSTLSVNPNVDDKVLETKTNTHKEDLSILPSEKSLEKKEVEINTNLLITPPEDEKEEEALTPEPKKEPLKQAVLMPLKTDMSVKSSTIIATSEQNIEKSKEEVSVQVKTDSSDKPFTTFQQNVGISSENMCLSIKTDLSAKSPIQSDKNTENKMNVNMDRNLTSQSSTLVTIENMVIKEALPTPVNSDLSVNTKDVNLEISQDTIVNEKEIEPKKLQYSTYRDATSTPMKDENKLESKKDINSEKVDAAIEVVSKDDKRKSVDLIKPEFKNVSHVSEEAKKIETMGGESSVQNKTENNDNLKVTKVSTNVDTKEKINNNHAQVPFGQWTEVNRQDFLNKIKESKIPTNSNNTNQIKHSNDLNRRDVLKKIDSQRQQFNNANAKAQEHKLNLKNETTFGSKSNTNSESKIPVKMDTPILTNDVTLKINETQRVTTSNANLANKESIHRKEVNHQVLIDKAVEGIIHKNLLSKEDNKQTLHKDSVTSSKSSLKGTPLIKKHTIDAIEMKMNELHGIPFVERPPHELPKIYKKDIKSFTQVENQKAHIGKTNKIPNLLPISNKLTQKTGTDADVDSEEEIIEHEPITGDIDLNKTIPLRVETVTVTESAKKESIITENDFDKFARRNSITYENCLTVKFDGKEPHNIVQTVIQKDVVGKKCNRNEALLAEAKAKAPHKPQAIRHINTKLETSSRIVPIKNERNCQQSKLQIAYQTALTVKKQNEYPLTVIEDKPVKVVYMDQNIDFVPMQLNVQGAELSPPKKPVSDFDAFTITGDSLDSTDVTDTIEESKVQEEGKIKKHQRKQVLNPVKSPDLELIEPADLGISIYSKKKRKIDDKSEKYSKNILSKKTYLLAGNTGTKDKVKDQDTKIPFQNTISQSEKHVSCNDTVSAIDNLVKAAELLESQSEKLDLANITNAMDPNISQNTPIKRGRGRPRKYPLPENSVETTKTPSPQKKSLLQTEVKKPKKADTSTDDDSTDDEMVRENWTMGKINENILCPICQKLFRSENVVFKHVKHCTGPSPSRSDSDKRTSLRIKSKDSQTNSDESDIEEDHEKKKRLIKKRKSRDSVSKGSSNEIIVIENTPIKQKLEKSKDLTKSESKEHLLSEQPSLKRTNLGCEICGKTFRQLSYLVNHKLQHKKSAMQPKSDNASHIDKSVFSCEVCKKEFRKLHHLVQHRIIHNPNIPSRVLRKSSSEQTEKSSQVYSAVKQLDDPSAAFRCEPCDKSFRKLHHLVEHRETHDGINRQKNTSAPTQTTEKPVPPTQCDKCKKTFRKLHHLINHKEQQHCETDSEKSDDKSVKSALSTKDIIHECSLCYMVFPNEHSLTKHTIICKRKKKQSAAKQAQSDEASKNSEEVVETTNIEISDAEEAALHEPPRISEERAEVQNNEIKAENIIRIEERPKTPEKLEAKVQHELPHKETETTVDITNAPTVKRDISQIENIEHEVPAKVKRTIDNKPKDLFKKDNISKEKIKQPIVKHKKRASLLQSIDNKVTILESNDDDVRYMINPGFKEESLKTFVKVQAKKRNSLQIERPNSKDLAKRRTSLQNPPKVARLKSKQVEVKATKIVKTPKPVKVETVPLTDSDDSDATKYSFPTIIREKSQKSGKTAIKPMSKTVVKTEERKSPTGNPKRKTLHNVNATKYKAKSPVNIIKKRTADALHRCDCGELFSSAALLSRHTTLAHTPPRIRRRRSPSVTVGTATAKPTTVKTTTRKSSVRSDASSSKKADVKTPRKSSGTKEKASGKSMSTRKTPAHKGVPVPEKMRKLRASLKVSNVF